MLFTTKPQSRKVLFLGVLVSLWFRVLGVAATLSGDVVLVPSEQPPTKKARDHSGVVVWLEPVNPPPPPPRLRRATMQQRNKTFIPHVLAVEVGAAVDFPNLDRSEERRVGKECRSR